MTLNFNLGRTAPAGAAAVAYGITTERLDDLPDMGVDRGGLAAVGFEAEPGQLYAQPHDSRVVLLVGLGAEAKVSTGSLRRAAAALARAAAKHKSLATDLATVGSVPLDRERALPCVVEGLALASYRFGYKSDPKKRALTKVTLFGATGKTAQAVLDQAVGVVDGVMLARDLVNEPGGSLTPAVFARRVTKMAREQGLRSKVLDEAAIKKAKLGGLLGVNRGSTNPPRFVELTYEPAGKATGTLALVGKGITFDAGGLSIKTGQGMMTMKCDMGGAAAVVGAMAALGVVQPTVRVRAYLPMTDNMLGGDATRPGDVLTIRNGKTIEVLNTDAEGRLILADALSLATEAKPDAIVDLATLTGACMVALGPKIAGVMGRNDAFIQQVRAASEATDERVWELPLPDDYRKMVDSPVADMKNIGGPHGGALTAGLILREFVGDDIPWAHIDIAGPAFTDAEDGEITKGGTGFGVRLLVQLVRDFQKP